MLPPDEAYAPFGEAYAQAGTTDLSFTGMNQDTVPNLYDFAAREYGIQGRWPSPDPAGLAAVNLGNPQTFNRYAYVSNGPLSAVDPSGLHECFIIRTSCGIGGGGSGLGLIDTGYTVDGLPVPADLALSVLRSGAGAVVNGSLSGAPRWQQIDVLSVLDNPDPSLLIFDNNTGVACNDVSGNPVPCDSSSAVSSTSNDCNDTLCTNTTTIVVDANAPVPDVPLNSNAIAIGTMVGNSFPDWLTWQGWHFSPTTCSWINLGVTASGAVTLFGPPEPIFKGIGVAGLVITGGAAILGNCI